MSLLLSMLICLVVQLCMGDLPVEEVIITKEVPLQGSWFEMNVNSSEVNKATEHAVKMFNTHSKNKKMFKLVSITAAQIQVTNVINYEIDAILGKTKCLKSENHDLNSCRLERKQMKCHFAVTFNSRKNKYESHERCKKLGKKA